MTPVRINDLSASYDLVIVGGGVTGAGLFHEASRRGFSPLLVEARDFAWGTSSRSSKMVHGGLRYLRQGKLLLTRSSVRERQHLLSAYPGLVTPLEFIMPLYDNHGPSRTAMKMGLSLYSLMAGKKQYQTFSRARILELLPGISQDHLKAGVGFRDAQVDDARLVLRLIFDGCDLGGHALNYTRVQGIERKKNGDVAGVTLEDTETGQALQVKTAVVMNATGVFAESLHPLPMKGFHIRPLRGSHLVFPGNLFPLDRVLSFFHPQDHRPIFLFPWEGCVFLGTTDVDHSNDIFQEPRITQDEADYLMAGLAHILPKMDLSLDNCIASLAGIRPVLSQKKQAPSKESRDHVVWKDKGLVTVTGGKLTTFRLLAADALKAARNYLPLVPKSRPGAGQGRVPGEKAGRTKPATSASVPDLAGLSPQASLRLLGRYGARVPALTRGCQSRDFSPIAPTQTLWAELIHGARNEQIRHLSDLLLRRVRMGLFLPQGGMDLMEEIQSRISPFLDWDGERWTLEKQAYQELWQRAYAPPGHRETPDNRKTE